MRENRSRAFKQGGVELEHGFTTNHVELAGCILSELVFSHKSYGESFDQFLLGVDRKSGYQDQLQIILSERLVAAEKPTIGDEVRIRGQIRTYNELEEGRNRLNIVVFAREFEFVDPLEKPYHENHVMLEGFLCKKPLRRMSPLGREICDMMLAVNRMYNKSDYIPCIAWGRNARFSGDLEIGTRLIVTGRIQSREYRKHEEDGAIKSKVAYEVSVLKLE